MPEYLNTRVRYTVKTGEEPGSPPLLTKTVKDYLKIDLSEEDDLIDLLIEAVTQFAETYTGRDLRTRVWIATFDCFEARMLLRRNQVGVVGPILYFNDEDTPVETTVDSTTYYPRKGTWWTEVLLKSSADWPDDVDTEQEEQRITIEFTTILPVDIEEIQVALLRALAAMYENRGDCGGCGTALEAATMASKVAGPFLGQFRIPRI